VRKIHVPSGKIELETSSPFGIDCFAISQSANLIAGASSTGVTFFDASFQPTGDYFPTKGKATAVSFSPFTDGLLVVGDEHGEVHLLRVM